MVAFLIIIIRLGLVNLHKQVMVMAFVIVITILNLVNLHIQPKELVFAIEGNH